MLPYVFPILAIDAVKAFVGNLPNVRIYDFGDAPQGVMTPYITWASAANTPFEHLSGAPLEDSSRIQIDCYAGPEDDQADVVIALARAVQSALDAANYANRVIINKRETDTRLFRISFEADIIANH